MTLSGPLFLLISLSLRVSPGSNNPNSINPQDGRQTQVALRLVFLATSKVAWYFPLPGFHKYVHFLPDL